MGSPMEWEYDRPKQTPPPPVETTQRPTEHAASFRAYAPLPRQAASFQTYPAARRPAASLLRTSRPLLRQGSSFQASALQESLLSAKERERTAREALRLADRARKRKSPELAPDDEDAEQTERYDRLREAIRTMRIGTSRSQTSPVQWQSQSFGPAHQRPAPLGQSSTADEMDTDLPGPRTTLPPVPPTTPEPAVAAPVRVVPSPGPMPGDYPGIRSPISDVNVFAQAPPREHRPGYLTTLATAATGYLTSVASYAAHVSYSAGRFLAKGFAHGGRQASHVGQAPQQLLRGAVAVGDGFKRRCSEVLRQPRPRLSPQLERLQILRADRLIRRVWPPRRASPPRQLPPLPAPPLVAAPPQHHDPVDHEDGDAQLPPALLPEDQPLPPALGMARQAEPPVRGQPPAEDLPVQPQAPIQARLAPEQLPPALLPEDPALPPALGGARQAGPPVRGEPPAQDLPASPQARRRRPAIVLGRGPPGANGGWSPPREPGEGGPMALLRLADGGQAFLESLAGLGPPQPALRSALADPKTPRRAATSRVRFGGDDTRSYVIGERIGYRDASTDGSRRSTDTAATVESLSSDSTLSELSPATREWAGITDDPSTTSAGPPGPSHAGPPCERQEDIFSDEATEDDESDGEDDRASSPCALKVIRNESSLRAQDRIGKPPALGPQATGAVEGDTPPPASSAPHGASADVSQTPRRAPDADTSVLSSATSEISDISPTALNAMAANWSSGMLVDVEGSSQVPDPTGSPPEPAEAASPKPPQGNPEAVATEPDPTPDPRPASSAPAPTAADPSTGQAIESTRAALDNLVVDLVTPPKASPKAPVVPQTPVAEDTPPAQQDKPVSTLSVRVRRGRNHEREASRARAARERAEREASERATQQVEAEAAARARLERRLPAEKVIQALTPEWDAKVSGAMAHAQAKKELAWTSNGQSLTRGDFGTLLPTSAIDTTGGWLNDEIVNAYLQTVVDHGLGRSTPGRHAERKVTPKYHAFNSFFYKNIRERGPASVERWTKRAGIAKGDLLKAERIFVPVHQGAHWTLLVVSPLSKTIEYFDSLGGSSRSFVDNITKWLKNELGDRFVPEEWRVLATQSPRQTNGVDCGVFTVTTAKMILLGINPVAYSQDDIPQQRRRMVAELLNGGFIGTPA
ncbi:MAG: hypothetical protein M1832_003610 [Thelocarpon impressellum]|nr:MAG: hypothetical protein M1832_003610 [Thelocarpon impressellum]